MSVTGDGARGQEVQLTLPTSTQHLRLARLVAAGVAAPAGLGVDDVDDLRIGVDELCATLVEAGSGEGPLTLTFRFDDGVVEVTGRTPARPTLDLDPRRLSLSKEILAVVADEHELQPVDDHLTFRLLKRRGEDRADVTD